MIEIVWRYNPSAEIKESLPESADKARKLLDRGNADFARIADSRDRHERYIIPIVAEDLGLGQEPGEAPSQTPFVAVLGCADARVPSELIFTQSANDVFAVRVAGNVLGAECVGSLDYAVANLSSVRLLVVLGHTGCGAVTAAVDAYLAPTGYLGVAANLPLRAIVDSLMPAVRGADEALQQVRGRSVSQMPGYKLALVETAVAFNAAVGAAAVRHLFTDSLSDQLGVAYGVYDLATRQVGLPSLDDQDNYWQPGLASPPSTPEGFTALGEALVKSVYVGEMLSRQPTDAH